VDCGYIKCRDTGQDGRHSARESKSAYDAGSTLPDGAAGPATEQASQKPLFQPSRWRSGRVMVMGAVYYACMRGGQIGRAPTARQGGQLQHAAVPRPPVRIYGA
jgi:hypothetical protein